MLVRSFTASKACRGMAVLAVLRALHSLNGTMTEASVMLISLVTDTLVGLAA